MNIPNSYPLPPEVSGPNGDTEDKGLKCLQRLNGKLGVMIMLMLLFAIYSALTMWNVMKIKELLMDLPSFFPSSVENMTSDSG